MPTMGGSPVLTKSVGSWWKQWGTYGYLATALIRWPRKKSPGVTAPITAAAIFRTVYTDWLHQPRYFNRFINVKQVDKSTTISWFIVYQHDWFTNAISKHNNHLHYIINTFTIYQYSCCNIQIWPLDGILPILLFTKMIYIYIYINRNTWNACK